jgi:hypothetical protein
MPARASMPPVAILPNSTAVNSCALYPASDGRPKGETDLHRSVTLQQLASPERELAALRARTGQGGR